MNEQKDMPRDQCSLQRKVPQAVNPTPKVQVENQVLNPLACTSCGAFSSWEIVISLANSVVISVLLCPSCYRAITDSIAREVFKFKKPADIAELWLLQHVKQDQPNTMKTAPGVIKAEDREHPYLQAIDTIGDPVLACFSELDALRCAADQARKYAVDVFPVRVA